MINHILEKEPNAKIVKYSIKEKYIITSKQQIAYNSEHAVKQEEYSLYNFFNLSEINKKKKKYRI